MTNFTLTKTMRAELAYDLTAKAVKKGMKQLEGKLIKLNNDFWAEHNRIVQETLQIDPARYDELLQKGLLVGTVSISGTMETKDYAPLDGSYGNLRTEVESRLGLATKALTYHSYRYILMDFHSPKTVPTMKHGARGVFQSPKCQFYQRSIPLMKKYVEIIEAAEAFHTQITAVLAPIKNYKTLIETLPEAAAFLKPKEKPKNNLVPTQLIESVRAQMMKGIPE